jgi:NAD(P)-dependent dehydrogenase (short-subunit alcohol dehydrogenase family)
MRFASTHALITGASRGLGAAFARALAANGHPVSLLARSADAVGIVARGIKENGGRAEPITCDVSNTASVEHAIQRAVSTLGPIGIVINNAGIVEPIAGIRDADPAAWARHIQINLIGAFNILHFAVPHLVRGCVVVNVSSGASTEPLKGRSAYCTSKAGLNMLGRIFELEEAASRGLRVHTFTPGPTDTGMHVTIREAQMNQVSSFKPAALQPVDEAATFLIWLCSDAAADLAGQFVDARDPTVRRRAGLS